MYSDLGVIIVAGGSSSRFGGKNKLLEEINGIPLFIYSLKCFAKICNEKNIILVCNKDYMDTYKIISKQFLSGHSISFTPGGKTRSESVINGLKYLNNKLKFVAVHDAARPLVNEKIIKMCYESCKKSGSGVSAKKITDTIKLTDNNNKVLNTVDRTNLWSIETPQIFKLSNLIKAYKKTTDEKITVTDDAGAMEIFENNVCLIENPAPNIKVTYLTDLNFLTCLLKNDMR